jgi:hypothetical protein
VSEEDKKKINAGRSQITSAPASHGSPADDSYLFDYIGKNEEETDDQGDTVSTGGQTGKIAFRYQDAMAVPKRDDLLSPGEIKRLLIVHKDVHKLRVDKQKATRAERAALKEGKRLAQTAAQQLGRGGSGGGTSKRREHPISKKAQFSGIDTQIVGIPSQNEANTNSELKDKLENQLQNQNRHTPKFNPRPRPPGG